MANEAVARADLTNFGKLINLKIMLAEFASYDTVFFQVFGDAN